MWMFCNNYQYLKNNFTRILIIPTSGYEKIRDKRLDTLLYLNITKFGC